MGDIQELYSKISLFKKRTPEEQESDKKLIEDLHIILYKTKRRKKKKQLNLVKAVELLSSNSNSPDGKLSGPNTPVLMP